MTILNQRDAYGWPAIALHWIMFVLLAGLLASGKYSDSLPSADKSGFLIDVHKQVGVAAFVLMAFRLLWRLANTAPIALSGGGVARLLMFVVHWLLYATVLLQSFGGVAMSQMAGRPVEFAGLFELPSLEEPAAALLQMASLFPGLLTGDSPAMQMRDLHGVIGHGIIILVALHIAGAFLHHFIWGDDTLRRMMFGYKPAYASAVRKLKH